MSVIVALGISGLVAAGLATTLTRSSRAQVDIELRGERSTLRRTIGGSLDCTAMFTAAGIDPQAPAGNCASTSAAGGQTGPWLRLMRRTQGGLSLPLTAALGANGAAKIGRWSVRASCSAAEQTLIVRVARLAADGSVLVDPLRPAAGQGWDDPQNLLFGGADAPGAPSPLCFSAPADDKTTEEGVIRAPMTVGAVSLAGPTQAIVVSTVKTPFAARCGAAAMGTWAAAHDHICRCQNTDVTLGANSVTFKVTSQICQAPWCSSPYGATPATAVIWSRTRGYLTANTPGSNYCLFNWSIQTKN